jgi:hypothetical protein
MGTFAEFTNLANLAELSELAVVDQLRDGLNHCILWSCPDAQTSTFGRDGPASGEFLRAKAVARKLGICEQSRRRSRGYGALCRPFRALPHFSAREPRVAAAAAA